MANELRIRQLALGGLVEDNPLTSGATTLTSAALAAVTGGVGSTKHLPIVLDPDGNDGAPEVIYVTALTDGADSATITRAQEGTAAREHVANTPWVHAPTLRDIVRHVSLRRATGSSISLNSTAIAEVAAATNGPGTGGFDLTVPAFVGDVLEWGFNGLYQFNSHVTSIDIYTMVSGSRTNPFGAGLSASLGSTYGPLGWYANQANGSDDYVQLIGAAHYTVVSGDLVSNTVTCRPYYAQLTAGARDLYCTASLQLQMWLKNLGPGTG